MYSGCSILYRQAIVVELLSVFPSLKHFWGQNQKMEGRFGIIKKERAETNHFECVDV